jgi:hypothetical protein
MSVVSPSKGITRIKIFENKELRRIFGSNKEELTGTLRKLYCEE